MSEIENSRESFNAASDANDSLEPGELKLTPPRSSPVSNHDVTRDQKRSSITSLDILKNYHSDHDDQRKDNEEDIGGDGGGGKYYEPRRNFQNNRRSPANNQRFYKNYNPNFRNNRNFKNRPGFNRGRGGFMHGRNRNFVYRNHYHPEPDFDNQRHTSNKCNLLSYTKTKPSISWRINEMFQNSKKIDQNVSVDDEKFIETRNDDSETIKNDKFEKTNKDNPESSASKHKKSKSSKIQRSESEIRNKTTARNKSKSSERSVKDGKPDKKEKKKKNMIENSDENLNFEERKYSKKKKIKKNKRKISKSEESEPKTPPLITKSTTPELKNVEKVKESVLETNSTVKSPTKTSNEQKLKRKISSSSNSSKKSKKHNDNKKNKLNPHSLSFVDDLYGNDSLNDIFPLSKDEPIFTKNESKNKEIKIKIENKSDSNMSDSPDTDEYQDMWEEDEELINSQISETTENKIIETLKNPASLKKSKSIEELSKNLLPDEILLQNIKIEKHDNDILSKIVVNQDLNNKSTKKFIEDIFSENSREIENDESIENYEEEKDIKDGLSTPIFVNPSPPSDVITKLSNSSPTPSTVTTVKPSTEKITAKVDIFQEDTEEFEPTVNPNKKLLFGMQDIYEQFLQSVTNAGIDISSNDNNESTPKQIIITKEIISPLELEATAPSISCNNIPSNCSNTLPSISFTDAPSISSNNLPSFSSTIENFASKSEPLTTELVLLHNEEMKSDCELPKRISSPSSSSTTSSSSSSSSSDSSDSSSTSTSTTSSTNSSDQKEKLDSPEYLKLFSKEDKKKLRALQKRLETLKSWRPMDEDEQDCFQGLQKVLENEINLLKRKYITIDNIEPKINDSAQIPISTPKETVITKLEPPDNNKIFESNHHDSNKIFDSNRDVIKMKISPKITNIPNKIWPMPIPQIFSIEEEFAKAKVAAKKEAALAALNEATEKSLKSDDKIISEKTSKTSSSQNEPHCSSSSRRSTRSPLGNRSPDKNHRDSNTTTASSRSPGRDRRSRGSPHSDNRKNHSLKSRRRNRHSRSRSHTPNKRFRGDSPLRKTSRRRDTNKSFRGGRSSFYRRSYSRSRSRSNSRSRFSRRRSISPYISRRYSRSPPFRPPSPPPSHKIRHGGSRGSTHSRSRSISPHQQRHIQRLSPLQWTRDENNCSQYYDDVDVYSSYSLSPNRSTLDNRINQELNIRPIGTTIPSYQSYTQFNSYNDYMPTMQINSSAGQFNNNPYAVGYQQNTNIPGNQQEYCTNPVTDDYHSSYYYDPNNSNEYQQNLNIKPIIRQDFKNHVDSSNNNAAISDFSIAVQKGNVLEIVPAGTLTHPSSVTDIITDKKIKEENHKIEMERKNFGDKKKIPSWKEEVNRRHVLCAVLKLNRETDGSMKSILIDTVPECSKTKDKKLVLFADGIRPGNGPSDEKSTIYKKEKKIRKSNKDKKKIINILHDNKENEQIQELLSVDTKIDAQLENAPPPPPPPGSPPPYLEQPILIRKNSPEQLLYFHFDPVVNSMYVSQIPNAIPPRLLNRQNQPNVANQSPGQLAQTSPLSSSTGNNGNGKSPSISSSPNILHDKVVMPKGGLPRCDKFINSPRIPVPTVIPLPSAPGVQYPTNTIGYHQRFHNIGPNNMKNTSMSSCNFSMPPPSINQQFQPLCFLPSSRPPSLEQLKRATATLPFNPVVPPPLPVTDNTPAFSSDSGSSSTSFFKNDNNGGISYSPHGGIISATVGQQFIRNDTKNSTNSFNITTVTSTP